MNDKILDWEQFAGYYIGAGSIRGYGDGAGAGDGGGYGYLGGNGFGYGDGVDFEYYFRSIDLGGSDYDLPTVILNYYKEMVDRYE